MRGISWLAANQLAAQEGLCTMEWESNTHTHTHTHLGADKSLARPERKQTRKHVRNTRDFCNIETRAVVKFLFLQGKAPKELDAILTETLAFFPFLVGLRTYQHPYVYVCCCQQFVTSILGKWFLITQFFKMKHKLYITSGPAPLAVANDNLRVCTSSNAW